MYKYLSIHNSTFPKVYCLPKIHKENILLRLLITSVNPTTRIISKNFAEIIKQVIYRWNRLQFQTCVFICYTLNGFNLLENQIISVNVVSLFANTPLNLVTTILQEKWN